MKRKNSTDINRYGGADYSQSVCDEPAVNICTPCLLYKKQWITIKVIHWKYYRFYFTKCLPLVLLEAHPWHYLRFTPGDCY